MVALVACETLLLLLLAVLVAGLLRSHAEILRRLGPDGSPLPEPRVRAGAHAAHDVAGTTLADDAGDPPVGARPQRPAAAPRGAGSAPPPPRAPSPPWASGRAIRACMPTEPSAGDRPRQPRLRRRPRRGDPLRLVALRSIDACEHHPARGAG